MLEHVQSKYPIIGFIMDLPNPIVVKMVDANINKNTVENLNKTGVNVKIDDNLMMDIVKHLNCRRI